jgi:radical SAM protein with 4Fe4S-binding SPASM domain
MKSRRIGVSPLAVLKIAGRLAPHPWVWRKLAVLQAEKWLFERLHPNHREGWAGPIRQLSLRLTDQCNLRCESCGQWGRHGFLRGQDLRRLRQREVPAARYIQVLQDLVRHGHRPLLYLWGGEPMLYRGTLELVEAATRLGLPVSIATNGSAIAEAAPRLVAAPLFLLQLSIDGHCAALHDRLRPAVGGGSNFRQLERALERVGALRRDRGSGLPLIASLTVVSPGNAAHLGQIYAAFRERVDLLVFYLSWWIDAPRARAHEADFARRFGFPPRLHQGWISESRPVDGVALAAQLQALRRLARRRGAPPVIVIPPLSGAAALRRYYADHGALFGYRQCISIHQAVEVDSNGDLSPCRDYHDYRIGNLTRATVTELWNNEAYRRFRRSIACQGLMPVCSRCCGLMGY